MVSRGGGSRVVSTVLYKPLSIGGFDYGEEQRERAWWVANHFR